MTRDEAIKTWDIARGKGDYAPTFIDAFVALGMLKLDEPKSAQQMAYAAFVSAGWSVTRTVETICLIDSAGLKIVEK